MAELKTYSPDRVKVIIGAAALTGAADGTFVTIEQLGDGTTSEAGAYGDIARAMNLDTRHTITVTLQQTSRFNDVLSGIYQLDRISGGDGVVPISVVDLRGTTLYAGQCWVTKMATATYSKGLEAKEWAIESTGEFFNGGNS